MNDLPKGWNRVPIGALSKLENGRAFKPSDWTEKGLRIVRIQNLNNPDAPYNRYNGGVRSRFLIDSGQLLFAWSGTPGTSFGAHIWNGGKAVLNQHIFKVIFDEGLLDKRFFKLAINQKLDELIGKAHGGVGLRHVTKGRFEETEIDLPPLSDQRRIVAKLDALSARSGGARTELDRIPDLLNRCKQAVLAAAFRGDLTIDWRAINNVSFIDSWLDSSLGGLALDVRYGTSAKCHYEPKATPVLRIPNVAAGRIDTGDLKYASFDRQEVEKLALRVGDLLVIRSNGSLGLVGRAALVTEDVSGYLYAGYLIRFRLDQSRVDPRFAVLAFEEPSLRAAIERLAKSTSGVNNINSEQLRNLHFPVPSLQEQKEIVSRVGVAFAHLSSLTVEADRATALLDRLDQAILAKAFRGEPIAQGL